MLTDDDILLELAHLERAAFENVRRRTAEQQLGELFQTNEETYMADFYVQNEGSVFLLRPLNDAAREWLEGAIAVEDWQKFGDAVAIEHRCIGPIIQGATADGFVVE